MVDTAPNGSNFVEVGSWFGKSTNYLATKIRESKNNINFTCVDTWKGTDDEELHQNIVNTFNGDIFYEFIDNTVLSNNYGTFNIIKDIVNCVAITNMVGASVKDFLAKFKHRLIINNKKKIKTNCEIIYLPIYLEHLKNS